MGLIAQKLGSVARSVSIIGVGIVTCATFSGAERAFALTAANGDFEAENGMTTSSTNIKSASDATASGGKALEFWVNGTATKATTTPAVNAINVYAKATLCSGAPSMTVKIDGAQVLNTAVSGTTYADYSANTALAAGSHSIQIGYANDYYGGTGCDRNLLVDRVEFTPGTVVTPPPPPPPAGCNTNAATPSNSDPGTVAIADNFESNNFSNWTSVTQNGDATAKVQSTIFKNDGCAALIHVTANSGSRANIIKSLPSTSHEVWATGWFDITRQGADTSSNVPTMRFFNGSTRLLDVSRQNGSGVFFVRWPSGSGYSWNSTGKTLAIGTWYQIKVHAVANAASSQVTVWLNGTQVFSTSTANFAGFNTINNFEVGAEHVVQDGDFAADDVIAKTL